MKVYSVRLTDEESEALERMCKETGKSPSELLRDFAVDALGSPR